MLASKKKMSNNGLSTVLVSVAGDESDEEAVTLACELIHSQRGKLYILYVIEVERGLPLDAEIASATVKGEEVLKRFQKMASGHKFETHAELLQSRRAGLAVVQEAVDKEVDAIVLGIPYRELYGSFSLGETVPYVLNNAPCRVILWRDLIPDGPLNNGQWR